MQLLFSRVAVHIRQFLDKPYISLPLRSSKDSTVILNCQKKRGYTNPPAFTIYKMKNEIIIKGSGT